MPARTLLGALLIDALGEFERAAAAIPAPGRHRRIGRLNSPGWTVGHIASSFDAWLNVFVQRLAVDPWGEELFQRQRALPQGTTAAVPLDEALACLLRSTARALPYLESADAGALAQRADVPPSPWTGATASYLVARSIAHLFTHAGDLAVTGALVGADDLGLPGPLAVACTAAAAAADRDDGSIPALARLALDARDAFERAAEALPRLAHGDAIARVNPGGVTVAHVADGVDRWWNAERLGRARDRWLAASADDVRAGRPVDFDEALAAYRRVRAGCDAAMQALADDGAAGVPSGADAAETLAIVAREIAHTFSHAGELAAVGSLAGAGDLGLPGALTHSAASFARA